MIGDQGDKWNTAQVSVYEQRAPFTVEIVGNCNGQSGIIAIDDIQFRNCAPQPSATTECPIDSLKCPNNNLCVSKYSFCDGIDDCGDESDENYTYCQRITVPKCQFEVQTIHCNWRHEKDVGSLADWFYVQSGANLNRMTGPVTDHTFRRMNLGYFLALNGSAQDYGKKSRIITPWVQSSARNFCALRFFYYMFGNNSQMGSINVYSKFANEPLGPTNVLFSKSGDLGQQWLRAVLPVKDLRPFQFVIEGQVGIGNQADLAIDDVSFSEGCVKVDAINSTIQPTLPSPRTSPKVVTPKVTTELPSVTNPSTAKVVTTKKTTNLDLKTTTSHLHSTQKISLSTLKVSSNNIPTIGPKVTTVPNLKTTLKTNGNVKGNTVSKKAGPNSMLYHKTSNVS
jgi:hypothetical protein